MKRKWLVFTAVVCCVAMLYLDQTAVSIILPQLGTSFKLTHAAQQWVLNSFFLAMTVLIAVGGHVSDVYGVKKSFLFGIIGFLIASVICASAINIVCLILGRILQGIFGALLLPTITVNIANAFPKRQVPFAMGFYVGTASIFLVMGPFVGGVITQYFNWSYLFWINIPFALIALVAGGFIRKHSKNKITYSFDWLGVVVLGIANTSFIFALMEGETYGWTSQLIISLFILSFITYLIFVQIEKATNFPIVDFAIFKNKQYLVVTIILFCLQFCIVTRMFFALVFQMALNKSPMMAGALIFPATLPIVFMAPITGRLLLKFGLYKMLSTGTICVMVSFIWLFFFMSPDNYILLFMGLLLFGISFPLVMNPSIAMSVISVDQAKRGMASGIVNQIRQLASSLGVAIVGATISNVGEYNFINSLNNVFPKLHKLKNKHIMELVLLNTNSTKHNFPTLNKNNLELIHQLASNAYLYGFRLSILFTIILIIMALIFIRKNSLYLNRSKH